MTSAANVATNTKFTDFKSFARLKELAKNPYDLTADGALSPERVGAFQGEACGFKILYGTERVDEKVMQALGDLADEAGVLKKMKLMQSGAVINKIEGFKSEERMVLHTAVRDFFEQPNSSPEAKEASALARAEVEKLDAFMKQVDQEGKFTDMIMIGIGGSNLGPMACYLGLEHLTKKGRRVHFISNVDPDNTAEVIRKVDLEKTLVAVVSKSGTTAETLANEELLKFKMEEAGLKPRHHFISVTGKGSPLDDKRKFLECFYIWDWIGGRYCSTSMCGGVVLAFAIGFENYWEFLRGANVMDKAALHEELHRNPPLLCALLGIWNRNFLGAPTEAVIPYSHALRRFSAHLQQLDMESNGKHIDRFGNRVDFHTGPIIWGEPGTNAQHSFFQLIHQGTDIIPLEMIGFKLCQEGVDHDWDDTTSQEKLLSNLFAQSIALATGQKSDNPNKGFEGNRPSHIILGKKLTPSSLGALLALYENKVAFQGFIWNINSFDQEGVQLGKVLATQLINQFALKRGVHKGDAYPLGKAFIENLETL